MKLKIILLIVMGIVYGCHCEKKAADVKPSEAPNVQSTPGDVAQSLNNLVVSFYSKGTGINRKAIGKFDNFLNEYKQKTNTKLTYKKTGWGREGETDYCISLTVMNNEQRSKFLGAVKDILHSEELVHLFENHPCRDIR